MLMIFDQAFFDYLESHSGCELIYFQYKSFFTIRGPIHLLQYGTWFVIFFSYYHLNNMTRNFDLLIILELFGINDIMSNTKH